LKARKQEKQSEKTRKSRPSTPNYNNHPSNPSRSSIKSLILSPTPKQYIVLNVTKNRAKINEQEILPWSRVMADMGVKPLLNPVRCRILP
jgi:hypothetical protein